MKTFSVRILEADNTFFDGEMESITIQAFDGEYGVWAGHENVVVAIIAGEMKYRMPDGKTGAAFLSDGMMRIEDNEVLILVDSAEWPEEIEIERVKQKEAAAREAMLQKKNLREYALAEASLKRAVARLRIRNNDSLN